MIGTMYVYLGHRFEDKDVLSRAGLLFYVDAFLVFMSIAVLPFFVTEKGIIGKEVLNDLYSPYQYQIARFITSLPGIALISIISSCLVVLVSGINGYGMFLLILFLSLVIAESLAMLVSILVPHYIIGMALIAGLYGMFMLCEGFLIIRDDIRGYYIWIYYIGFHTYSFESFMYNEFINIPFINSTQYSNGKDVLAYYSMSDANINNNLGVLLAWIGGLEICIFFVMFLKFMKKRN